MLYFILAKNSNRIKIGYSISICSTEKRFAQLKCENGDDLTLLAMVKGMGEKEVHFKFMSQRHHGEWFNSSNELLEYIKSLPNEDKVSKEIREKTSIRGTYPKHTTARYIAQKELEWQKIKSNDLDNNAMNKLLVNLGVK